MIPWALVEQTEFMALFKHFCKKSVGFHIECMQTPQGFKVIGQIHFSQSFLETTKPSKDKSVDLIDPVH